MSDGTEDLKQEDEESQDISSPLHDTIDKCTHRKVKLGDKFVPGWMFAILIVLVAIAIKI